MRIALTVGVCLVLASAADARVSKRDLDLCGGGAKDLVTSIESCTAVIDGSKDRADRVMGFSNRGAAYVHLKKYDLAIRDLDQAIALDPSYIYAIVNRATAQESLGQKELAAEDYRRVLAIKRRWPNAEDMLSRGLAYDHLGQTGEAIESYTAALLQRPRMSQTAFSVRYAKGADYIRIRRYDLAIGDLDEALRVDPSNVGAYSVRAQAHRLNKEFDQAIADADKAIALDPHLTKALSMQALFDRARAYEAKGDIDRATADFDAMLQLDPRSLAALNGACWIRAVSNRDLAVAESECDEAVRLSNNNPGIVDSRAVLRLQQRRYAEAWTDFDAVLQKKPGEAPDLYGRGLAASRLGRSAEGQADLAAALKIDPGVAQTYASYGLRP